jgi:trimeric autotransporter adhesin
MFLDARSLITNLSSWNTSKATNTAEMLDGVSLFNDDLPFWNTSQVTNMDSMFSLASSSHGIGLKYWDVRIVGRMEYMFDQMSALIADLSLWNTSKVTSM